MIRLFISLSLPYFQRRWLKVLLTLIGMAIGVAVFVAIDLTNRSISTSIENQIKLQNGKTDYFLWPQNRFLTNEDYRTIATLPEVRSANPILEAQANCPQKTNYSFTILGNDPLVSFEFFDLPTKSNDLDQNLFLSMLTEQNLVLLPSSVAQNCGIADGKTYSFWIQGRPISLKALVLPKQSPFPFAMVDIATAQETFGQLNQLSRIDLKLQPSISQLSAQSLQKLNPGLQLTSSQEQIQEGQSLLRSFQLNLKAFSFIAILVAVLMVYHAANLSILYRRSDLGLLLALGLEPNRLALLFLGEILICGAISGLAGIGLGKVIGSQVFEGVRQTLADFYQLQSNLSVGLTAKTFWVGFAISLSASLTGAIRPLWEIITLPPAQTLKRGSFEQHLEKKKTKLWILSICFCLATALFAKLASPQKPSLSFVSTTLSLLTITLLASVLFNPLLKILMGVVRKIKLGFSELGLLQMAENSHRYGIVVGSFVLGIALWLGVGTMVSSFRQSLSLWLDSNVRADIYLMFQNNAQNGYQNFIPQELITQVNQWPQIEAISTLRNIKVSFENEKILLSSVDLDFLIGRGLLLFMAGSKKDWETQSHSKIAGAIPAAIAEPLARKHQLNLGSSFEVESPWGRWPLKVEAILYDYTTEQGLIYVDRRFFQEKTTSLDYNSLGLYLKNPSDTAQVASQLQTLSAQFPPNLEIRLNQQLHQQVFNLFDQTFQVTQALKGVALWVAFLGIISALLTLIEEKRRDISLLQALGMNQSQLFGFILSQGLAIALIGYLLGAIGGILLTWILVKVVHPNFFGWTLFFKLDSTLLLKGFGFTLLTGLAASLIPTYNLSRKTITEGLRFEE